MHRGSFTTVSSAPRPDSGHHFSAFERQTLLYREEIARRQTACRSPLHILDMGSGELGAGRAALEAAIFQTRHRLSLFDPYVAITPPIQRNVDIVAAADLLALLPDIVNVSYVLNGLEPPEAFGLMGKIRQLFPEATVIVVDYVLKGRAELAALLQSHAEQQYRRRCGDDEFVRTRTRFSAEGLTAMACQGSPDAAVRAQYLDPRGMRMGVAVDLSAEEADLSPLQRSYVFAPPA